MNVQALTGTSGELVFLGEAHLGSTHDVTAARADGIIIAVTDADVETSADSGYQGAGGTVRSPIKRPMGKGHNGWEKLANTALARLRAPSSGPLPHSNAGACWTPSASAPTASPHSYTRSS